METDVAESFLSWYTQICDWKSKSSFSKNFYIWLNGSFKTGKVYIYIFYHQIKVKDILDFKDVRINFWQNCFGVFILFHYSEIHAKAIFM